MTEQDLMDLKKEIEQAKEKRTRLEGRMESLLEQLQTNFGVKTIIAAKKKLKALEEEINQRDEKIKSELTKLEAKLEEDGPCSNAEE